MLKRDGRYRHGPLAFRLLLLPLVLAAALVPTLCHLLILGSGGAASPAGPAQGLTARMYVQQHLKVSRPRPPRLCPASQPQDA